MYRSIRNSHIPPPRAFELFSLVVVKFPTPVPKTPFTCPTSRLNSVVKCRTSGPLSLRKLYIIWAEISVSSVFPKVTNRNVMSATINISSTMITEGSGSCSSVWRQTRAVFMRNAARTQNRGNKSNSPPLWCCSQMPHPKYVAVRQIAPSPGIGGCLHSSQTQMEIFWRCLERENLKLITLGSERVKTNIRTHFLVYLWLWNENGVKNLLFAFPEWYFKTTEHWDISSYWLWQDHSHWEAAVLRWKDQPHAWGKTAANK